jgi:hypothetical protein
VAVASGTTYRKLARRWLDRLSGPLSSEGLAELRPDLPHLIKVLDWASSGHDLLLSQELFAQAESVLDLEGHGEKACEWSTVLLTAARTGVPGLSLTGALRRQARALRSRFRLRTEQSADLVQALSLCDEAFQRAETPELKAEALGDRGQILGDLAAMAGENRALRLRQALDHFDSALLRAPVNSGTYFTLQNNRAIVLPQLASLPGEDRPNLLRQALDSLTLNLEHIHKETDAYAILQLNRASLLQELSENLPEPARGDHLRQGIQALEVAEAQKALSSRTQGKLLVSRSSLLRALSSLPGEDRSSRLREALAVGERAIEALPDSPLDRAMAEHNRGATFVDLSRLAERPEERIFFLRQAVAALDTALSLRYATTAEKSGTLFNRAVAFDLLAKESEGEGLLRDSLASAIGALVAAEAGQHLPRRVASLGLLRNLRDEILSAAGEAEFDRWWREITERPQPDWTLEKPISGIGLQRNQEILRAYMNSRSSEERTRLLRLHSRELLAEETLDLFEHAMSEADPALRSRVEETLSFFRRCREIGVDATLAEAEAVATPPPPHLASALELLRALPPRERVTYLSEQPELSEELKRRHYITEVFDDPLAPLRDNDELAEEFLKFFNAETWDEARRAFDKSGETFLRHRDLFLKPAQEIDLSNELLQRRARRYDRLLRRCREAGADVAFAEAVAYDEDKAASSRTLLNILREDRLADALRHATEAPPEFPSEATFEVLADLAQVNTEKDARQKIDFCRTLLRRMSLEGRRPAFASVLAGMFASAGNERREVVFADIREVLTLEEVDAALEELLEASRERPASRAHIEDARWLHRRAWEIGFETALEEFEIRQDRISRAYPLLMELMDKKEAGEQPRFVIEHREALLDPVTLDLFEEMSRSAPVPAPTEGGEDSLRSFLSLIRLLRRCAEIGVDEAFAEQRSTVKRVLAFLAAEAGEERLAFARRHADVLLSEQADIALFDMEMQFRGEKSGLARRAARWRKALRNARVGDLAVAFAPAEAEDIRAARWSAGGSALLAAGDLEEQRQILHEYSDVLLTEEAEEELLGTLRRMLASPEFSQQEEAIREQIAWYRNLLRHSRSYGIEAAFTRIQEEQRREEEMIVGLAEEIERLADALSALSPTARARLTGQYPLLVYRVRQLLRPQGESGPATPEEELRAAAAPVLGQIFETGRLDAKRELVERYRDLLLAEETESFLGEVRETWSGDGVRVVDFHRALFRRCREVGVATAFAEFATFSPGGETAGE